MTAAWVRMPGPLAGAVRDNAARYDSERIGERIWSRDHTVWKPVPTEITDRLSWLWAPERYGHAINEVTAFADSVASDADTAILLGMGGSSLAPEVMHAIRGPVSGRPRLLVVDSTDPSQVRRARESVAAGRCHIIVSSKSGTTIETLSQYAYFREHVTDGARFSAITDPGSQLETIARNSAFRGVFLNDPDIGGRFSALSYFGLVPAALTGTDISGLLASGRAMAERCGPATRASDNEAAMLGILMGTAAMAGRDKLTLVLPPHLASFGWWVEQLVAESSGKEGKGIVPVEGEPPAGPGTYGDDRLFVAYGDHPGLDALEAAGHPMVRLPEFDAGRAGGEFWRWEYGIAVACWLLGVNPFDQPNVQEAKDATAATLLGKTVPAPTPPVAETLAAVRPGDYVAINAFIARTPEHAALLQRARVALRDRFRVATVTGFGPRFLHSTGQLHKGGANNGVFLQVVGGYVDGECIPGQDYTFAGLISAQADGDLESLQARGRRVSRITVEELTELAGE